MINKIFVFVSLCVCSVASVLSLCDPMDCRPPGSSVRGVLQAKILEWVAIPSDPLDCSPPGPSVHGIFQARVLEWGAFAFSEPVL